MVLRPLTQADLDFLYKLVNDPNVAHFIGALINDRDILKSWIENLEPSDHEYVILSDSVPVGECSLTITGDSGAIGCMIIPEYWNHGYGFSAIKKLIMLAQENGLKEVTAATDEKNIASVRILENAGFSAQAIGWMISDEELESMKTGRTIMTYVKRLN